MDSVPPAVHGSDAAANARNALVRPLRGSTRPMTLPGDSTPHEFTVIDKFSWLRGPPTWNLDTVKCPAAVIEMVSPVGKQLTSLRSAFSSRSTDSVAVSDATVALDGATTVSPRVTATFSSPSIYTAIS